MSFPRNAGFFASLITFLTLSAIQINAAPFSENGLNPIPPDSEKETVSGQLSRWWGQKSFMNMFYGYVDDGSHLEKSADAPGSKRAFGGKRSVQESDIYKIPEGKKKLYLLNTYRGLQAIDYSKGAKSPVLEGRAESTGNFPNDMYLDQARNRLIVLERIRFDESGRYNYSRNQSRLLVYDVSKKTPALSQTLEIEGEIADSRMVGSVLYVATVLRPNRSWGRAATSKDYEGRVFSFDVSSESVRSVNDLKLQLPVVYRQNLNIVEVEKDGKYSYYLIATLSERGWFSRESQIEVVDISDPKGKIRSVMVVSAKGRVAEKSQTQIEDDTLMVVSNYIVNDRARIAVETFKFPSKDMEVLGKEEYSFREAYIQRELSKVKDKDQKAKRYKELIADKELGIQGRFVINENSKLEKGVADSVVTTGDTTGMSASLQDVRWDGDLLYTFWVPANQIDPFDLFDISNPREGIQFIKRLQFDGWIERSEPFQYDGKKYVIGLGWVVDNVDNETGRRSPQAMLFEIKGEGKNARAYDIAQISLKSSKTWVNFNSPDKFIEFRVDPERPGAGYILFQAYTRMENKSVSGGKLIGFDLSKAEAEPSEVFKEGGMLRGSGSWLRRVFTNLEIDKINTFTNEALGTYSSAKEILDGTEKLAEAIHILELARNIRGYAALRSDEIGVAGIQIISEEQRWWFGGDTDDDKTTELRVVKSLRGDSELVDVASTRKTPGSLVGYSVSQDGRRLFVASAQKLEKEMKYQVTQFQLGDGYALKESAPVAWTEPFASGGFTPGDLKKITVHPRFFRPSQLNLIELDDGSLIVSKKQTRKANLGVVDFTEATYAEVNLEDCKSEGRTDYELHEVGDTLYLSSVQPIKDEKLGLSFGKNYIAEFEIEAESTAKCGGAVNIPGRILQSDDRGIVTADDRVIAIQTEKSEKKTYRYPVIQRSLVSLRLSKGAEEASLVDLFDLGDNRYDSLKPFAGKLYFFEYKQKPYNPWGYFGGIQQKLIQLGTNDKQYFNQRTVILSQGEGSIQGDLSILSVVDSSKGEALALVGNGRQVQVLAFDKDSFEVESRDIVALNPSLEKKKAAPFVTLPTGFYSYAWGNSKVHYTPDHESFEIPLGLSGVSQLFVK